MVILRLVLVLGLAILAGLLLAWMYTKDGKFLRIAGRIVRFLIVLGVVVALVFIAERLILI
jgi:hypothetical protein